MHGVKGTAEAVDVVDAEDRVIGSASRDEAHASGFTHRFVQAMVLG